MDKFYKRVRILFVILMALTAVLELGCKKKEEKKAPSTPADPSNTVSLSVRNSGNGSTIVYISSSGAVQTSNPSGCDSATLTIDSSNNFQGGSGSSGCFPNRTSFTAKLVDIGSVSGLGAVTSIPSDTPQATVQVNTGHGYVLSGTPNGTYRIYVVDDITCVNSFGVTFICGYDIKIAPGP